MYMSYSMSYTWYDVAYNVGICKSKSTLRDTSYHAHDIRHTWIRHDSVKAEYDTCFSTPGVLFITNLSRKG